MTLGSVGLMFMFTIYAYVFPFPIAYCQSLCRDTWASGAMAAWGAAAVGPGGDGRERGRGWGRVGGDTNWEEQNEG